MPIDIKELHSEVDEIAEEIFQESNSAGIRLIEENGQQILAGEIDPIVWKKIQNIFHSLATIFKQSFKTKEQQKTVQFSNIQGFNYNQYYTLDATQESLRVYHDLNTLISIIMGRKQIEYALYIRDLEGNIVRQNYSFENLEQLLESTNNTIRFNRDEILNLFKQKQKDIAFTKHVNEYLIQLANQVLKDKKRTIKEEDALSNFNSNKGFIMEMFEWHYQRVDKKHIPATHSYSQSTIKGMNDSYWARNKSHEPWFTGGDIGQTQVKFADETVWTANWANKANISFLSLANFRSLNEVYSQLKYTFGKQYITPQDVGNLVMAFTQLSYQAEKPSKRMIKNAINNILNSLLTK